MKQSLHPSIRNSWMLLHHYYRRLQQRLNSPWTKAAVLLLLVLLVTRQELTFSLSINGGSLLSTAKTASAASIPARNVSQLVASKPVETFQKTEARQWTAKEKRQLAYVSQYLSIAQKQMRDHGIPASITLAQGLLESNIGKSRLARENNNHFGIKCFSKKCKKGHCTNFSDDSHKDFFMKYGSAEKSYHAHSSLLKKARYKKLFTLQITDYKGWAKGLRKAGYATDPKYADKLIALIENLNLNQYDESLP